MYKAVAWRNQGRKTLPLSGKSADGALAPFLLAHLSYARLDRLVERDVSRLKNSPYLDNQLVAAVRALAEANASLREVTALAAKNAMNPMRSRLFAHEIDGLWRLVEWI
jgi:hypothetical protein